MSTGSGERAQRTDSCLSGPHRTQDHLQAAQGFLGAPFEEHCWSPAKARGLGGGDGGGGQPDLARKPRAVGSAVPPVSGHVQWQRDHGVPEPLRGVRQTMNEKDTRTIRPTAALHSKQPRSSGVPYSDRHEGVWTRCEAVQPLLQLKSSLWGFLKTETRPPARSSCQPVMLVGETFPLQYIKCQIPQVALYCYYLAPNDSGLIRLRDSCISLFWIYVSLLITWCYLFTCNLYSNGLKLKLYLCLDWKWLKTFFL